jgi:hypothetical protein
MAVVFKADLTVGATTWHVFNLAAAVDSGATGMDAPFIERLGGRGLSDIPNMFQAANPLILPLGNVKGQCVFTVETGYSTRGDALEALAAWYALLNSAGSLVITVDSTTLTMPGAYFDAFDALKLDGLRYKKRFTFNILTLTSP